MTRLPLLSLALIAVVSATTFTDVPFQNCNSLFEVKTLEASECSLYDVEVKGTTKQACLFYAHTKPTIKITFVSNETGVTDLETSVRAKFGASTLPYEMSDFETCKHGGITCPLIGSQEYTYSQAFHIDRSYPKGELFQVNWVLAKGDKKFVCTVFLAKIFRFIDPTSSP